MVVKSQVNFTEWTKTYQAIIPINDLFSGQFKRKINCFMKPRLKTPSKTTMTSEDISKNRELKFANPNCFLVRKRLPNYASSEREGHWSI